MNTAGLLLGSGPEGVTGVTPVTAVPAKNAYTLTKAVFPSLTVLVLVRALIL